MSEQRNGITGAQRELLGIWSTWPTDDEGRISLYGRGAQRSVDMLVDRGYLIYRGHDHGRWHFYEITDAGREVLR